MLSKKEITKLILKGVTCRDCATSACKRKKRVCQSWTNRADVPSSVAMLDSQIHELVKQLAEIKNLKISNNAEGISSAESYIQNAIELYTRLQRTYSSGLDKKWAITFDKDEEL